ncbi:MAG: hypothetical protein IPK92_11240 [Nitrospira sp.]|nr:hypothetical protein [Nitrospira sp.]MBL8053787.1 hypothetical protein [Nitrospira sp.]
MAKSITLKQKSAIKRVTSNPTLAPILFSKAVGLHWFRPFEEAGFLSPNDIPGPIPQKEERSVSIPGWPITHYLVETSPELREPENEEYAIAFVNFIRASTRFAKERNFGNYRVWWQFSKVLCNIPPHLLSHNDLELVDYWLDDKYERGMVAETLGTRWLHKLLDHNEQHCKDLSLGAIDLLYKTKIAPSKYGFSDEKDAFFRFENYFAKKITQQSASKAGQALGMAAVILFQKHLQDVLHSLGRDQWSSIRRRAIENHAQNDPADDVDDILIDAYRDALLACAIVAPEEARQYVANLLEGSSETLQRVAIYTIDKRFQTLRNLTENVLIEKYFESNFRHELWHLLNSNFPLFTISQKKMVKERILSLTESADSGQPSEAGTAYRRALWLSSIKSYDEDVAELYQQCVDIIGGEPQHPDFSSYITSGYVSHKSPISLEELLSLDTIKLIEYLNSYRDPRRFDEPGIEGLVKTLRNAIKAQPLQFHKHLHQFLDLDLPYVHALIEAFSELWTEQVQLPWDDIWGALLDFCETLVKQGKFWAAENARERSSFVANRFWITSSISRLVQNGTQSEEHAFPQNYLDKAESVLRHILDKEAGEEFKPECDAVRIAINSPRGQCLEAFINLAWQSCRLADKEQNQHKDVWKHFRAIFDIEVARQDGYECATLIARHIPLFVYMAKEWTEENMVNIFDRQNYQKWLCAMQGYSFVNAIYDNVYKYLKSSGDFCRGLADPNLKEQTDRKIIENIAVAYLNNLENLEDPKNLIDYIINNKLYTAIHHLIWFIWSQQKNTNEQLTEKVLALWKRLIILVDHDTPEGKALGSKLCDWLVFIEKIDDLNRAMIHSVVACTEENRFSYDLLDSIARISERQPEEAFKIWKVLLQAAPVWYPEEAILSTFKNLVNSGISGKQKAKEIADDYLRLNNPNPHNILQQLL